MLRFILTRVSLVIPTFIGITLLAFFLVRLIPGDPIETLAGERGIDPVRHEALRKEYGFDRPILVQYAIYIGHLLRGDFGRSIITRDPVLSEFLALFPATVELSLCAIVFALVLGMGFLVLLMTFRSIVVPIKAIVLNLLSVGAAYGVLVLVFQEGLGEGLLDFRSLGGITSWLPLFLFVVLFGLSMDYHVFILTRVRELVDGGMRTPEAVDRAIRGTAGVVTSAAMVMVAVFAVFATLSDLEFKQMGVGLAAAILIDATIIRALLVPAAVSLFGRWNWWLPAPAARLLRVQPSTG